MQQTTFHLPEMQYTSWQVNFISELQPIAMAVVATGFTEACSFSTVTICGHASVTSFGTRSKEL